MLTSDFAALDGLGLAALIVQGEGTSVEVKEAAPSAVYAMNPRGSAECECWDDTPTPSAGLVKDIVGSPRAIQSASENGVKLVRSSK